MSNVKIRMVKFLHNRTESAVFLRKQGVKFYIFTDFVKINCAYDKIILTTRETDGIKIIYRQRIFLHMHKPGAIGGAGG